MRSFTENDPIAFLNQYAEGMLLDEVHHAPNLLSYIQGMVDEDTNSKNKIVKINKRMRTCLRIAVISVSVRCICGLFVGAIARIILEPTNIRIKAVIKFKRGTICKDNSVTARLRKMQATQLLQ